MTMSPLPREIEVSRVVDLVKNFEWEKVKEEVQGDTLFLTIKKKIERSPEEPSPGVPG